MWKDPVFLSRNFAPLKKILGEKQNKKMEEFFLFRKKIKEP
jgi:hypothetical protein